MSNIDGAESWCARHVITSRMLHTVECVMVSAATLVLLRGYAMSREKIAVFDWAGDVIGLTRSPWMAGSPGSGERPTERAVGFGPNCSKPPNPEIQPEIRANKILSRCTPTNYIPISLSMALTNWLLHLHLNLLA